MSKKEKFALYLTPEKKALLERRYQEDGSRSLTGFIERAIDFYLDYLSAGDAGLFLPASIKSCMDGRLDQLEDRLAALAFRQAVETDMMARYPGGHLPAQPGGTAPPAGGERAQREGHQRPHIPEGAVTGDVGGGG